MPLASLYSRASSPASVVACKHPCKAVRAGDDQLSSAAQKRIVSFTGRPEPDTGKLPTDDSPSLVSADSSACDKKARTLGPTLRRFNRYRDALPYARAASDMSRDPAGSTRVKTPCLTRLPDKGDALCAKLGLKRGTITDKGLRNDETGFRAAMYRDESTGKLILVARDTEPTSLVDWQTNTRNGDGQDTKQYAAMRKLSGALKDEKIPFDVAGYSKGGGLAQEAALVNHDAKAYVFNGAGLHPNSLLRTGNTDFGSLASRTQAYSSDHDFLTYMNQTTNPEQQIANVKFLRRELAGENRPLFNPMKIDHRNPEKPDGAEDADFIEDKDSYLDELDQKIANMEADRAAGRPLSAFPPVRAGQQETIPDSLSQVGQWLGADEEGPNLGKLAQHQMDNVLLPLQVHVDQDRAALQDFISRCGLGGGP